MVPAGKRYVTYGSRSDEFSIWNVADVHYGARGCNKKRFLEDVARIKADPYSFWVGGGDYADYISPKDKRWSCHEIDPEINVAQLGRLGHVQAEWIRDAFRPIAHKCVGLLLGNHETKYMAANEQSQLHGWLCTELGVPDLGYAAMFDMHFVRDPKVRAPKLTSIRMGDRADTTSPFTVRFCCHHGFSGAATPGGKLNTLIRWMNAFDADVYMLGHVHDQKGQRSVRLGADAHCSKLTAKESVGVITGAYLETYTDGASSYGEQRGYAPVPLGAVRVLIKPDKQEIRGEV